ncbi:MAG: DUF5718 family protein [Treponema sp.]|nr:DUF5718 family protein [Treponema sp.]
MNIDFKKIPSFGVAGNFTGHLEQAGEAIDFINVKAALGAPKALFPTYIPGDNKENSSTPAFLHTFPFDSNKIIYPQNEEKLQIEPECAIICQAQWKDGKVISLKPQYFTASNDCSIRKEGAKKISLKKNWGPSSKGISENLLPIDEFSENGIINNYRIASFLVRDGKAFAYGENSFIKDYSYIYQQLLEWIIDKINNQEDQGPAEKIGDYLQEASYPQQILISIGATRYTDFGEHNFLQKGDISLVMLYPDNEYSSIDIQNIASSGNYDRPGISVLAQKIF